MKKAIIKMLSVLCIGLMVAGSAAESIEAVTYTTNSKQQVSVQTKTSKKTSTKKAVKQKNAKSNKSKKTTKKATKKTTKKANKKYTKGSKVLTKEQALQLVQKLEPEVDGFTYMGNENTYKCIKENGIKGYVFLPNCDGDMAYLVDKQTSHIYYFHPSGYFELLQ